MNGLTRMKRVAILIEQGVEDSEFQVPYNALRKAGAEVVILGSRMNETYKGKQGQVSVKADGTTTEAQAAEFDAVVIPGGMAPDRMRTNEKTVRFVRDAIAQGKWVAAVCHGPQVLIEGDLLRGKQATGFIAIRKDMQNAGAEYLDQPLVEDGNLLTARRPGDLPIFVAALLMRLGLHVPDTSLPNVQDNDAGWWKLGEEWGGSTKAEIVDGINTAIAGERYAVEAFEGYADRTADAQLKQVFNDIIAMKQQHIAVLQRRLQVLGETESLQAAASSAYGAFRSWLQSVTDDTTLLLRAIGDLQTGVVDIFTLRNQFTDPATVAIFDQMEVDIAKNEQRLADLYHARLIAGAKTQPPQPTSGAAVSSS